VSKMITRITSALHFHALGWGLFWFWIKMAISQEAINCTSWRVGKSVSRDIQHTIVDPDTSKTKRIGNLAQDSRLLGPATMEPSMSYHLESLTLKVTVTLEYYQRYPSIQRVSFGAKTQE